MEAEVREHLESSVRSLCARDVDALMAHYAPDMVTYDLRPPLRVLGRDGYRKNFEVWFSSVTGNIDYELRDLHVAANDGVAFTHYLAHVKSARANGTTADYWVRVTSGLRKVDGKWTIIHEHISMPIRMETMQADPSLQP